MESAQQGQPSTPPKSLSSATSSPPNARNLTASHIDQMLLDIYERARPLQEGQLADYIPELANVPPNAFGIALATTKGKVHAIGDADLEFTIRVDLQSIDLLHGARAVRS